MADRIEACSSIINLNNNRHPKQEYLNKEVKKQAPKKEDGRSEDEIKGKFIDVKI